MEIFPEDYYDCLNMNREEIAGGSDTETDSVSDDDNIWIWMFLFDINFLSYKLVVYFTYLNFYSCILLALWYERA